MRRNPTRVIVLAAMLSGSPLPAKGADAHHVYRQGKWRLVVRGDRFARTRACTLRSVDGRMSYQPGAIGFHMRDRDTLHALYRIDEGPAERWQDRYAELLASGVEVEEGALDDPTGRIVWIPEGELRDARTVRIRTGDHGSGRLFRPGVVNAMIAAARGLGCFGPVHG